MREICECECEERAVQVYADLMKRYQRHEHNLFGKDSRRLLNTNATARIMATIGSSPSPLGTPTASTGTRSKDGLTISRMRASKERVVAYDMALVPKAKWIVGSRLSRT